MSNPSILPETTPDNCVEILSPLSPEECAQRILAAIDSERSAFFALTMNQSSKPVVGRVDGRSFRLRKRPEYRNSFQPVLSATMVAHDTGTLIRGEFAMPAFARAFIPIWLIGVGIFSVLGFEAFVISWFLDSSSAGHTRWVGMIIPPLMLIFGIGFVRSGRQQVREETAFLTGYLCRVLDARSR